MAFRGRHALVVGGSSGMGLESARLLAEAGAAVTLVGRNREKLERAREGFENPGESYIRHDGPGTVCVVHR